MGQNQVILRHQKFTFPRANGRASGPVLTSLFLFNPDHSGFPSSRGTAFFSLLYFFALGSRFFAFCNWFSKHYCLICPFVKLFKKWRLFFGRNSVPNHILYLFSLPRIFFSVYHCRFCSIGGLVCSTDIVRVYDLMCNFSNRPVTLRKNRGRRRFEPDPLRTHRNAVQSCFLNFHFDIFLDSLLKLLQGFLP